METTYHPIPNTEDALTARSHWAYTDSGIGVLYRKNASKGFYKETI